MSSRLAALGPTTKFRKVWVLRKVLTMTSSGERIDLRKALLDPALVFRDPEDVLKRDELTREQQIEILHRWKFDALQLQVAEDENMGNEQPSDILDRVLQALNALNAVP